MEIGQESTQEYFKSGQIKLGDRFNEMLSFFINVISADDKIVTLEGNPNSRMEIKEYDTFEDFKKKCAYSTMSDKYWVYYTGNDIEKVKTWIHHYKNNYYKQDSVEAQRQLSIEKILYTL
jgi:hypothetical protein